MPSIKDLKRMCNTSECPRCDLLEWCKEDGRISELPDDVDSIVYRWVKTHPLKTYKDDFFEKFPNAPRDSGGAPKTCWKYVYGDGKYCCSVACTECWNREMKEQ